MKYQKLDQKNMQKKQNKYIENLDTGTAFGLNTGK